LKRLIAILLLTACPAAAQIPRAQVVDPVLRPDTPNDFFLRGKNVYDTAQQATDLENRTALFQRAADIFTQYLDMFPNHQNAEMAWWHLGNSLYQSGRIDEGKRCFSTLINRYGEGKWAAAAAYTLAAEHYNKGEYVFAAPMFERYAAHAARPEERARGNYFAGNSFRMQGRTREAAARYNKVLEDPAGALFAPQSMLALGQLALSDGRDEEAIRLFEEIIANTANPPKVRGEAALQAAQTATKLGITGKSDQHLDLVMRTPGMEEFRAEAQTAKMANLFAKKEYRQVISVFRSSAFKAGGVKEAARLMIAARAYMRLKQPQEALGLFREVERLVNPQSEIAFHASYYRLLCFYQIEGRHVPEQVDAFLQLYRRSNRKDPRIHTALMMKAETLFADREVAKAAKAYSEIDTTLLSEKNRPGLLYQRGWCLAEAGDHQGAVRSLGEFISLYPEDTRIPSALAKRARSNAAIAEPQKAIADFDKLIAAGEPPDLVALAWLESARMRRADNQINDMITRYQGLLQNADGLTESHQAEAHYWIGWGMVKNNSAPDAVSHLEKARELRPDAYRKHAGILLALGYFATQDAASLSSEINLALKHDYIGDIPDQVLQWTGMQAFNNSDHELAVKCLAAVATTEEPRATPKEVWRYLAKSRLETGDLKGAVQAVGFLLDVEDNPAWKADGLLDRGRAQFRLDQATEARQAADEALALRPQGRTSAGLRILLGDLEMKAGDARKAAAEYLIVVNFHDDRELRPLAIWKLISALAAQNDEPEAEKYRRQLKDDFPDWQPPTA
jgi:TolA-binding protein